MDVFTMKKVFIWLKDNLYFNGFIKIYGVVMLFWGLFSYFDLMPFYQVKLFKINSITPTVNLFPGQKIRLNFDFHQVIARQDINAANWQLLKDDKVLFEEKGLEPTISLPLTDGGIYQLRVNAKLIDETIKTGQINLYVVQDIPKQVILLHSAEVNLTTENNTLQFLKNVQSNGAEVYVGNGQWAKVEIGSSSENKVAVKFKPNEPVSSFNDEMLIRAQGSAKDLSNYGTAQIPYGYNKPTN
jgi:hypothetical protein